MYYVQEKYLKLYLCLSFKSCKLEKIPRELHSNFILFRQKFIQGYLEMILLMGG